jgi:sulfite exporter TauE/SafE
MLALAIGTAPALGAVALVSSRLWQGRLALARAWGLAVVAVGCWTLVRGWTPPACCPAP